MGQAKQRQKEIEALKAAWALTAVPGIDISNADIVTARNLIVGLMGVFGENGEKLWSLGLRPSAVASPLITSILRNTPDGFPVSTDEALAIVRTPEADVLRGIYKRFLAGESTPQQFSDAAIPLLLKLHAVLAAQVAEETQELIEEAGGQDSN